VQQQQQAHQHSVPWSEYEVVRAACSALRRQLDDKAAECATLARLADEERARADALQRQLAGSGTLPSDLAHVQAQLAERDAQMVVLRARLEAAERRRGAGGGSDSEQDGGGAGGGGAGGGGVSAAEAALVRRKYAEESLLRTLPEAELLALAEALSDAGKAVSRRLAALLEEEADQSLCTLCLASKKNTVLIPCGHMCMCAECAKALTSAGGAGAKCPVCRAAVRSTQLAYT
jgi:hypothetical protein